jgi:hypothetical protein
VNLICKNEFLYSKRTFRDKDKGNVKFKKYMLNKQTRAGFGAENKRKVGSGSQKIIYGCTTLVIIVFYTFTAPQMLTYGIVLADLGGKPPGIGITR